MWWVVPTIMTGSKLGQFFADKGPPSYKRSKEEQDYINRLEKESKYGSVNVGEQMRFMGQQAHEQAAGSKVDAVGRSLQTGMTSSLIQHELFRRVDRDTQKSIIESSRQIAEANEQSKRQALQQKDEFLLNESGVKRQYSEARQHWKQQRNINAWGLAGEIAGNWYQAGALRGASKRVQQRFSRWTPMYTPAQTGVGSMSFQSQGLTDRQLDGGSSSSLNVTSKSTIANTLYDEWIKGGAIRTSTADLQNLYTTMFPSHKWDEAKMMTVDELVAKIQAFADSYGFKQVLPT